MSIGIFSKSFHSDYKRGIAVYSNNLVLAMERILQNEKVYLIDAFFKKNKGINFPKVTSRNFNICAYPIPGRIFDYVAKKISIFDLIMYKKNIDIIHYLHENTVKKSDYIPSVVTVHSLAPILYPDCYKNDFRALWIKNLNHCLKNADAILSVSKSLKNQLIDYDSSISGKCYVTRLGVREYFFQNKDYQFDSPILKQYGIKNPFILYVGAADPNKNLMNALEAFHIFVNTKKAFNEHTLVIIGNSKWGGIKECESKIGSLGIERKVIFTGYIDSELLPIFYRNCEIFLFPSIYESFGLPLLEAMASGAACLTSNRPAMDEIGGDSVAYCDPSSPESIAFKMSEIASNEAYKTEISILAQKRASIFSWENTAKETISVYEKVTGKHIL